MNKISTETELQIVKLLGMGYSTRAVAHKLFGHPQKRKSTVWDVLDRNRAKLSSSNIKRTPKILSLDLETSASVVYSFRRFKANISPDQVIIEPYLLTLAGKYVGSSEVTSAKLPDFDTFDIDHRNDKELVEVLWQLLDDSDVVIAHNAKFDVGWANQRFVYHKMMPPSPYHVVDTLQQARRLFSLPANSLKAVGNYFELPNRKLDNGGWSLWQRAMEGDPVAFEEMEEYNVGDIVTREDFYLAIRPFMKTHPNIAICYDDENMRCPRCGGKSVTKTDKVVFTAASKFESFRCDNCTAIVRGRANTLSKEKRANLLA